MGLKSASSSAASAALTSSDGAVPAAASLHVPNSSEDPVETQTQKSIGTPEGMCRFGI